MLALFLVASSVLVVAGDSGSSAAVKLEPRPASWSELQTVFPQEWMVPRDLWAPADEARREQTLPLALARLAEARFDDPPEAPAWTRSFGDVVQEARKRGPGKAALSALLGEWKLTNPASHAACAKLLREVHPDGALKSKNWDGEKDLSDDGMFFGPVLKLNPGTSQPWSGYKNLQTMHQAAALVNADLEAIKAAHGDYPSMLTDPGTSYEKIGPKTGTFLVGSDEERGSFAALRIGFRSDLPFPFGHYDCDLGILDMLDEKGRMTTFVFTPSQDFYWFAGQDWHHPIRASDGEFLGILLVRIAGFDLQGVPDGDSDRMAGTRVALGNLKRRSEAAFLAYGGPPRTLSGAVPSFEVLARVK